MRNCKNCGENKWSWRCENGLMEGTCGACGQKTNKFKANGKHNEKKTANCEAPKTPELARA